MSGWGAARRAKSGRHARPRRGGVPDAPRAGRVPVPPLPDGAFSAGPGHLPRGWRPLDRCSCNRWAAPPPFGRLPGYMRDPGQGCPVHLSGGFPGRIAPPQRPRPRGAPTRSGARSRRTERGGSHPMPMPHRSSAPDGGRPTGHEPARPAGRGGAPAAPRPGRDAGAPFVPAGRGPGTPGHPFPCRAGRRTCRRPTPP